MDERDLRRLFQEAPGEVPPPSFGLADVQAASRRAAARQRMRIAMASSAAALVLVGGGLFAAVGPLSGGGNSGGAGGDIAAEAPQMGVRTNKQPSGAPERPSDGGFPSGGEASSKQGGGTFSAPEGNAARTERCAVVDRELAPALAGELPGDPSTEPIPGDQSCPAGVTSAAYRVSDGPRRGVVSVARVSARLAASPAAVDQLNADDLPDASAEAADGSVIVVVSRGEGSSEPPYASRLLQIAEGIAAAWPGR